MSRAGNRRESRWESWTVMARHDWESPEALETTLRDALGSLEGEDRLYRYVDVEAVRDSIAPDADARRSR